MAKTVAIGSLAPGDLCFMDGEKLAKVIVHIDQHIPRHEKTKFENEIGNIDWVWSHYKVTVD